MRPLILREHKLSVEGLEIGLDCTADVSYLSHAHSDHLFTSDETVCSKATAELAGVKKWKSKFEKKDLKVSLHDAGHILGSTQLLVENGKRFVYTGDFKLEKDVFGFAGKILKCDELMIESTYGSEAWVFPEREKVYSEITDWVMDAIERKESVMFGAYALGKGQEIVKLLNNVGIVPLVHPKMERMCGVYDKNGFATDRIVLGTKKANELLDETFVAVLPQGMVNRDLGRQISKDSGRTVKTAAATGWATTFGMKVDKTFVLSDHADFSDILKYVHKSGAKKVYCCHGQNKKLAGKLNELGIEAIAV